MIMTQQQTPRLSMSGIALALSLALAGWASTPARSSEPDAGQPIEPPVYEKPTAPVPPVPPLPPFPEMSPIPPVAPIPTIAPLPPIPPFPPVGSVAWFAPEPPEERPTAQPHGDLERRMERLEQQLERLADRLERLAPPGPSSKEAPPSRRRPDRVYSGGLADAARAFATAIPPLPRPDIVRTYRLPQGQLEALTKLMIRSDVPIRVRPRDDAIEVHGTAEEHARFRAFVEMLSGKDSVVAYRLPEGKLQALTELMGRDDVPIMVEPGSKAIKVHGSPAVQAVFRGFVEMIHPMPVARRDRAGAPRRSKEGVGRGLSEVREKVRRAQRETLSRGEEVSAMHLYRLAERLGWNTLGRQARTEIRRAVKELSKQALKLERQAERLEDRAEHLRDKANELRDRVQESDKPEKTARLEIEADEVEAQADALESQMDRLLARAEALQDQAEAIETQADKMGKKIEAQLERQIEEAKESAENHRDIDEDNDADDDHHDGEDEDEDDDDDNDD